MSTNTPTPLFDGATGQQIETLSADTPTDEVHQYPRPGGGINADGTPAMLSYVTARFVQDRLDVSVGPANWQSVFSDVDGGTRCGIGILVAREGSPEWVWKYDVGIFSNIERVKGSHSDAFKRAGVQWGIARDLYDERDDRREEAVAAPQMAQMAPTIAQQVGQPVVPQVVPQGVPVPMPQMPQTMVAQPQYAPPAPVGQMAPWACPVHGTVKLVPAGISRRSNRAYDAFLACDQPGCDHKGPSVK